MHVWRSFPRTLTRESTECELLQVYGPVATGRDGSRIQSDHEPT
jgi:hypothetical protein